MAERGRFVTTDGRPRVIMVNGNRQELNRKTGRLSFLYFDRYSFDVGWLSKKKRGGWLAPKERFIGQLLHPGDSEGDKYYRDQLIAEGHGRLTVPLYSLAFVIIALAVLLSGEFNKRGQTVRLVTAVTIGVAVQGAALGLLNLAAKVPEIIPLMYVNALAPSLIGLYVLGRGPRRGRPYQGVPAIAGE